MDDQKEDTSSSFDKVAVESSAGASADEAAKSEEVSAEGSAGSTLKKLLRDLHRCEVSITRHQASLQKVDASNCCCRPLKTCLLLFCSTVLTVRNT